MKANISITIIVYIVIGIVVIVGLGYAVKEVINNIDDVDCAAGEEFCDTPATESRNPDGGINNPVRGGAP